MADLSAIKLPNGSTYDLKDSKAVKKAGDTMTGTLDLASNKYYESSNTSGLDANNSDIIGVNSLYFNDASDQAEAINFYRDATHVDSLYGYNGKMYFVPNRPLGGTGSAQELYSIPNYGNGTTDISIRPYIAQARANRLAFLPASQVIIEKTTDGGTTWVDAGYNDAQKIRLFNGLVAGIQIPLLNGAKSTLCGVRITLTGMRYDVPSGTAETAKYNYWNSDHILSQERYFNVREWWFWVSANNDTIRCQIEAATGADSTNWRPMFNTDFGMTGWSGSDWIRAGSGATFGGGTTQTTNYWNWRLTFWSRMQDNKTAFQSATIQQISTIYCFGDSVWGNPNSMSVRDHLYTWDDSQNATFPARVTAPTFSGALSGNASTATEFSANKSVALTGDVTGSASSKAGWSVATTLANSGVTAGSYGPTGNASPAAGGTISVPQVTVDAKGRVTGASTKSVTLPTDASTVNGHTVGKDVPSNAVFTDTTALGSMTGTLSVGHGGTGNTTFTSGSYLVGNGGSALTTKTSSEVLSDIGAVSKSGDTMTGDLYINSTGNTDSIHLRETDDNRGAMYVDGPSGCGKSLWYSNVNGSSEIDFQNASGQNRAGMYVSVYNSSVGSQGDTGVVYLKDSSNNLATIVKEDVDRWNSVDDTIGTVPSTQSILSYTYTSSNRFYSAVSYTNISDAIESVTSTNWRICTADVTNVERISVTQYIYGDTARPWVIFTTSDGTIVKYEPRLQGEGLINKEYDVPYYATQVHCATFSNADNLSNRIEILAIDRPSIVEYIQQVMSNMSLSAYPVGSIYMSVNSTDPGTLFGGTWERLQDTFLLAAGSTYSAGSTGGEATHKLTTSEMPSHQHQVAAGGTTVSSSAWGTWNLADHKNNTYTWSSNNYYRSLSDCSYIAPAGGSSAHNNMPPYLAVYMWKRIA